MFNWLKTALPAVVAAVLAALVTFILPKVFDQTPSKMYPTVSMRSVEVPMFSRIFDKADVDTLVPILPRLKGTARDIIRMLAAADRSAHLNIIQLELVNSTSRRTKSIEVAVDKGVFAVVSATDGNKTKERVVDLSESGVVNIDALDPRARVAVVVGTTATYIGWGEPSDAPVKVLIEGQLVDVQPLVLSPRDSLLLWANRNWPDGAIILQLAVWASVLLLVLIVAFVIFAYASRDNFALLSKAYTRGDVERVHRFSAYLKEHRPSKDD